MGAEALIERLDRVRANGPGRWMARCPAHEDGRASLSVRELDGGRTLVHCFAGCTTDDVIAAAGLPWSALFADQPAEWPDKRFSGMRPGRLRDLAAALGSELTLALIVLGDLVEGRAMTDADRERGREAKRRIVRFLQELENAA